MPKENEGLETAKRDRTSLNNSWSLLRRNDSNFFYAAGAGLLSAFFKRPYFALFSGVGAGFLYNKRALLVDTVHTDQNRFINSYQRMMREDGISALNDPDVLDLTETATDNKPLEDVKTWKDEDLKPQNSWGGFWQSAPVSSESLSRLNKMKDKQQQSTDLQYNGVNFDEFGNDALKRAKKTLEENTPKEIQDLIKNIRSGL